MSSGEDGKIFIWKVEDSLFEGWGSDEWEPVDLAPTGKLNAGGRKVGQVVFHPAASNILTAASGDHLVRLWDIEAGQDAASITLTGHNDSVQSMCWNPVGNTLATTCRDRKLRLFDPRAGADPVRVTDGHGGIKGSRVVWLGDRDRIATTGFSRMSDRQLSLWETGGLTNLDTQSLDSSAGVIIPFFAEGNDVLFLAGKGDGNIRYYEFEGDQFHFLNQYQTSDPQRGMGFLPRRSLDVSQNEIARAFKLSVNSVEPLSFIVPRKAEGFQSDIFPPANSIEPALTAAEWLGGKTTRPNVVDLETMASSANSAPITPFPRSAAATPAAAPSPVPSAPATPKEAPAPKAEPKVEPKAELKPEPVSTPVAAPTPEPTVEAKNLEIEQPEEESEDEVAPAKVAAVAAVAAGAGAAVAASGSTSSPANGASVKPVSDQRLLHLLTHLSALGRAPRQAPVLLGQAAHAWLAPFGRLRPVRRCGHQGARARQGACRHAAVHCRPRGHVRQDSAPFGPRGQALDRHGCRRH